MRRSSHWLMALAVAAACVGTAAPAGAEKWALLVGVEQYQRPEIATLRYSVADVRAVARTLDDTCRIPADHVFVLTSDAPDADAQPTKTNITFRLEYLAKNVKPGDQFIFYFSGHGMLREGRSYLLTVESDARSLETLEDSAYPVERLHQLLNRVQASEKLVFMDACRRDPASGRGLSDQGLSEEFARSVVVCPREGAAEAGDEGTATFYACKVGQRAYEWPAKGRGFFSYFVEEGLRGEAADAQGQVTVNGLEA